MRRWPAQRVAGVTAPIAPDQLVYSLRVWGGLVPPLRMALSTPNVALYGDGRLVTLDEDGYVENSPFAYDVASADPRAVAAFVADAEASALVDEGLRRASGAGAGRHRSAPRTEGC